MSKRCCSGKTVVCSLAAVGVVGIACGIALAGKITTEDLGGPERYLTHISTDKPIYRPGEPLYVRGTVLNCQDNTPLKGNGQVNSLVEIKGPKGDTITSGYASSQNSVIGFQWEIPSDQAGGEYKIRMSFPWHGLAPAERRFDIRAYRAPRLKSQIVFLRKGYGPGDEAGANLHVERAEGGFPAGAKVTAIARVDGAEVYKGRAQVDARGNCSVRFQLPKEIARGEGSLAMVIEDGGVVETAAKTIPILLQTVDLSLYPEGGDLVAGLPCRVYLEAKTPAQKPADLAGVVVDGAGNEVARYRTEHEGRGWFEFTPEKAAKYTLKIAEPSGIKTEYPLPEVKDSGAVVSAIDECTDRGAPVRLKVATTFSGPITVSLSKREAEASSVKWEATAHAVARLHLKPPPSADGVLIATVWDKDGNPLAERLIYRRPSKSVKVVVMPDRKCYVPGGKATLRLKATDDSGKPVSAIVGVTVTDDSVLEMIEKREQAPRLPVMVFLEGEVRELADAHVYLDGDNAKAPLALDLLLGTQGWRRFALANTADFIAANGDKARRALALRLVTRGEEERASRGRWRFARGNGKAEVQEGAVVVDELKAVEKPQAARPAPPEKHGAVEQKAKDLAKGPAARKPAPSVVAKTRALAKKEVESRERSQLRRAAANAERDAEAEELVLADEVAEAVHLPYFRVYAHLVRPNRQPGDRTDFTETLYWNAGIKTDQNGEAQFSFALNDSVTSFRVLADAFSEGGALGQDDGVIESVEPFYIEPKLPLEVTSGDVIQLPVSFVNGVSSELREVGVAALAGKGIELGAVVPFALGADERVRRILEVAIGKNIGASDFVLQAKAGPYSDKVTRKLRVAPLGFPTEVASGGVLAASSSIAKTFTIPDSVVRGSVTTSMAVYPTPLANLTDALARLIREPHGCFEQTSSTTYPLVMAQQYFLSHHGVDPSLVERSHQLLDRGYKRLISFECKKRGYEWFAGDPGHEALTAYGLLEFTDMAKVREVDSGMLSRTREWLMKARDGKGGFSRKRRALHTWIVDKDCSNGYILWSLLECGGKDVGPEIESFKAAAGRSTNSYVLALAANVMSLAGDKAEAKRLMGQLAAKQTKDGWVGGATTSIVGSGGESLKIETTSLSLLAWLRDPAYAGAVEKGIRFLSESCQAGRYGSTQATVLALRAIVEYDKARAHPTAKGTIQLFVDGRNVGAPVPFDKDTQGSIKLPDIGEVFEPGDHKIELRMADGSQMPYSLAVNYHSMTPASAKECRVGVSVGVSDTEVSEGAVTEANVVVTNQSKEATPMAVAVIGVPGGLEPRHDQLKELVKSGKTDAYEVIGREVVLYWRSLTPEQKIELPLSLVAAVPGTYTGPASRAYLYYTDEFKTWVDGMKVTITPLDEG